MHRTLRMLDIIARLQQGSSTLAQLASHYECSTKTIQRDLDEMASIGIPVVTTRGRHGGISIDSSWWLGPLNLTQEEIETIILAMENASFLPGNDAVLTKVRAAVRPSRFDSVAESGSRPIVGEKRSAQAASFLTDIRRVLERELWCQIEYNGGSLPGWRTILPREIFISSERWYVSAVDERSREMRTFRLDRISDLVPTLGPKNAAEIIQHAQSRPEYTSTIYPEVIAELTEAGQRFCQDHPHLHKCLVDGRLQFRCPPSDYPFMARDLMRMGTNCRVISPPGLKAEMIRTTVEMLEHLQN